MIGVIGGSGFYELFSDAEAIDVATPFGPAAAPVTVGRLHDQDVAFLPRHGVDHRFAPHRVPYRANIWALHSLGVRSLIAPCSVGSLQPDIHPEQMVVVDQLVDRTHGRADTFHDAGAEGAEGAGRASDRQGAARRSGPGAQPPMYVGAEPRSQSPVHHQSFADPYDEGLRAALVAAARRIGIDIVERATMVVINGPRFSTSAESRWFQAMGWHLVNMTGYPEAVLAAELGVRYATVALVTDHDAGLDGGRPVTMEHVFAVMAANVARVRELITATVADLGGRSPEP